MELHDYSGLNDVQCWHVDHFRERFREWGWRLHGEAIAFRVARADAQKRFPLEPDEAERMDEYISTRFGKPKAAREPEGRPAPVLVAG